MVNLADKDALRAAVDRLGSALGIAVPRDLEEAYLRGADPHLVGYEKRVKGSREVAAIVKYLLLARSYLAQPALDVYYDIFRAARAVAMVRRLDLAVQRLTAASVAGIDERLRRLSLAKDLDDFDSVLFEVVTADRYGLAVGADRVSFIADAPPRKSPDIRVDVPGDELFVECKHVDRMTDAMVKLSDEARDAANVILGDVLRTRRSAVVEVVFDREPGAVDRDALRRAVRFDGTVSEIEGARVVVRPLERRALIDYELYPSPRYFSQRYGFVAERWHGVVPHIVCRRVGPSFLDDVEWEGAVLWRIENDALLWKMKRLAFKRVFEGLEQLRVAGKRSALHVWIERHVGHGHRKAQLTKLVDTLEEKKALDFSWIVLNETVSDVSVGGHFDFQEHASPILGDASGSSSPPVTNVFMEPEDFRGRGEWGVGVVLPSMDEESSA